MGRGSPSSRTACTGLSIGAGSVAEGGSATAASSTEGVSTPAEGVCAVGEVVLSALGAETSISGTSIFGAAISGADTSTLGEVSGTISFVGTNRSDPSASLIFWTSSFDTGSTLTGASTIVTGISASTLVQTAGPGVMTIGLRLAAPLCLNPRILPPPMSMAAVGVGPFGAAARTNSSSFSSLTAILPASFWTSLR